jgi:hypothetical protein
MKKVYLIVGVVLMLMILSIVYMITQDKSSGTVSQNPNGVTFPVARDVSVVPESALLSVRADGGDVEVNNFMLNNDTYADTQNAGYYYLGNTFTQSANEESPSFVVVYIDETDFFNITLLKEPVRDSRIRAEAYLLDVLGIAPNQMCALQYSLSVPAYVNEAYSGINLKFSFCPGAVAL